MVAREVIDLVMKLVADRDLERVLKNLSAGTALEGSDSALVKRYISALNIAVDTINSRYYANVKIKRVTSDSEGKIPYEALDERVYEVLDVKTSTGMEVEFYSLPFSLYLPAKSTEYTVRFKYLPEKVEWLTDEVAVMPFVPLKAVSYLMASDIFLTRGLYDDAKFWFNNFESVMNQASSFRKGRCLAFKHLL